MAGYTELHSTNNKEGSLNWPIIECAIESAFYKIKGFHQPCYFSIAKGRSGFMPFPWALVWKECKFYLLEFEINLPLPFSTLLTIRLPYYHQVALLAWIFLTVSFHLSLSSIVPSSFSKLYLVFTQSWCR